MSVELIEPAEPLRDANTDEFSAPSESVREVRNPDKIGGALLTTRFNSRCPPLPLRSREGPASGAGSSFSITEGIPGSEIVGEAVGGTSSNDALDVDVVNVVGIVGMVIPCVPFVPVVLALGNVNARERMGVGRSKPTRRTRDTAIVASAIISAARERDRGVVVKMTK